MIDVVSLPLVPSSRARSMIGLALLAAGLGATVPFAPRPVAAIALLSGIVGIPAKRRRSLLAAAIPLVLLALTDAPRSVGLVELLLVGLLGIGVVSALPPRRGPLVRLLFVYLALLSVSGVIALLNGTGIDQWFRGVAPLMSVVAAFLLYRRSGWAGPSVPTVLLVAALVWSLMLLQVWAERSTGVGYRVTYDFVGSSLPLTAFGVVFGLARPGWLGRLTLGCSTAALLTTGSRGLLLAALLAGTAMLLHQGARNSKRVLVVAAVVGLAVLPLRDTALTTVMDRLEFSGDIAYRQVELQEAVAALRANPVMGRGPGWTFDGGRLQPLLVGERIAYTHNSFTYFAMTLGIVGVIVYHALLLSALLLWWRRRPGSELWLAAGGVVVVVAVYGMVEPTFRHFHTNIYLGLSLAILAQAGSPGIGAANRRLGTAGGEDSTRGGIIGSTRLSGE